MGKSMNVFGSQDMSMVYDTKTNKTKSFTVSNETDILGSNLLFTMKDANWYNKCNRYGWIDPYDHDRIVKEYLFFTKPDLNIFADGATQANVENLTADMKNISTIAEVAARNPYILGQLQSSVKDPDDKYNPFMFLLSNAVASRLDLPAKSADSQESTQNIMGTSIQYRGHSHKSNNGYDFSLTFNDTAYLEVYNLVNCYDKYMEAIKLGFASPKDQYIINNIISDQFSIYKFLVGSDGETIIYYAKLVGCYFTDVPRTEFSDPAENGFKYSLSFHAQHVFDDPWIIQDFNSVAVSRKADFLPIYNSDTGMVNNQWARYPRIIKATTESATYGKRVGRRGVNYDYFLKWIL